MLVTKSESCEDYFQDYIIKIVQSGNRVVLRVKLKDLQDNLNLLRALEDRCPDRETHEKALETIKDALK